jgi:hypothetical protein
MGTVNKTTADINNILNLANGYVAAPFSSATTYAVGDYCSRNGKVYRCNTAGAAAWSSSRWTEVVMGDDVAALRTSASYSSTDPTTGAVVSAKRFGNLLQITVSGQLTLSANTWAVVATLPESCRPAANWPYATMMCQTSSTVRVLLSVYANGQVRLNASGGAISSVYFNNFVMGFID